MTGVSRFEDLIAWQKARLLTRRIYEITRKEAFARDYGLSGQIQRAAVSVMSNLAEGFERGSVSNADFHRFIVMAKASCAEVRSQVYVALDIEYINQSEFNELLSQANEVARLVNALRASVDRSRYP